jgi:SAM-dependent methyltransferase
MKQVFENIYKKGIWSGNNPKIPLSGPGSSIANTFKIIKALDKFVVDNEIKTILDIGCGDLTWIKTTNFFNNPDVEYVGIDIVEPLINSHAMKYSHKFKCMDITENLDFISSNNWDLIICRDMLFHNPLDSAFELVKTIKDSSRFYCLTSHNCRKNLDNLSNSSHYSQRNLFIEPFCLSSSSYLVKIDEPIFDRSFYIFSNN